MRGRAPSEEKGGIRGLFSLPQRHYKSPTFKLRLGAVFAGAKGTRKNVLLACAGDGNRASSYRRGMLVREAAATMTSMAQRSSHWPHQTRPDQSFLVGACGCCDPHRHLKPPVDKRSLIGLTLVRPLKENGCRRCRATQSFLAQRVSGSPRHRNPRASDTVRFIDPRQIRLRSTRRATEQVGG